MKMNRYTCLAAVLLVGWNTGCTKKEPAKVPEVIRPVYTMVVAEPGGGRSRLFTGTARAAVQTPLSFRVSGEIIELPAQMGMALKAGDLVARVDPKDHDLQVKQSEAQLAATDAQLDQAKANYERVRQLYETENVSKSELDSTEASFKSALAQKQSTLKALELARQQLEYCTLRAPVNGSLGEVPVELHQTVSAGQSVAILNSGEEMQVQIGIPEALIGRLQVGEEAEIRFEAIAGAIFAARVSEISVAPTESRTYPVKLQLLQKDDRIRSGMVAEAQIIFKSGNGESHPCVEPVAVVPTPDGKRFVWVYNDAGGVVRQRFITIGDLTSDGLEVLEGLKAGERIVTRGVHKLSDGMKVRLLDQAG